MVTRSYPIVYVSQKALKEIAPYQINTACCCHGHPTFAHIPHRSRRFARYIHDCLRTQTNLMRNEALSHLSRFSNNNIDSHDIDEKAFPPSPCAFSAFMKSVREKRHMSRLASQLQLSAAQTVLRRPLRMLWVWLRGRIYRCLSQPQQQKTTIIRRVYLCWCFCLFFFRK